jgi:hypothetical protein
MAVKIVEKDKRPKVGKGKDHEKIELSSNQMTPGDVLPDQFEILKSEDAADAEYIGDGQHGTSAAECRKIQEASASDRGKSSYRKSE